MGYVIQVGNNKPQKVFQAVPDPKNMGQPIPDTIYEFQKVPGAVLLINRCRIWARRVLPEGAKTETPLEVNDPKYKGDLEFLDWGDPKPGSQAIEIRYLPMSRSLDFEYQKQIQKIDPKPEEGFDMIELQVGENKFDEKSQALLIQLLKVNPQNRNSKSKNPEPKLKGDMYFEVTEDSIDKSFIKQKEASLVTGKLVSDLSLKPVRMRNLFKVFVDAGVDFGQVSDLSNDSDIYTALLVFADNPSEFGKYMNAFKASVEDDFSLLSTYKMLETSKDGFIGLKADKTGKQIDEILFQNIPVKSKDAMKWVIDNFYNEGVFNEIYRMKSICDDIKKS